MAVLWSAPGVPSRREPLQDCGRNVAELKLEQLRGSEGGGKSSSIGKGIVVVDMAVLWSVPGLPSRREQLVAEEKERSACSMARAACKQWYFA